MKPKIIFTKEANAIPNPDPLHAPPVKLEGFLYRDFWESLESGRSLPTEDSFFADETMKMIIANFKSFSERVKRNVNRDFQHPPKDPIIPSIIHFIWLGSPLTTKIKNILSTWLQCHPGWEIWVWSDEDMPHYNWLDGYSQFVFSEAKTWAEKSDVLRYDILYQHGGIYTDIDSVCLKSFNDLISNGVTLFAGQETNRIGSRDRTPLYLANGLMGVSKGHPVILHCINNLKTQEEAPNDVLMYRTGPVLFTRACLEMLKSPKHEDLLVLPCSYFYPLPYFSNLAHKRMNSQEILTKYISPETMAVHLWEESWKK